MTLTSSLVLIAVLGGSGYLLYTLSSSKNKTLVPKEFIYDDKLLFTPAMWNNPVENRKYWQNRFLDPLYKKGEPIHYSIEAQNRNEINARETAFSLAHPYN